MPFATDILSLTFSKKQSKIAKKRNEKACGLSMGYEPKSWMRKMIRRLKYNMLSPCLRFSMKKIRMPTIMNRKKTIPSIPPEKWKR